MEIFASDRYDVVFVDESAPISFDNVYVVCICNHAGFKLPDRENISELLNLFPNAKEVTANIIDSRLKDRAYSPTKVGKKSIPIDQKYKKETYLSNIPMTENIFENVLAGYEEIFKEIVKEAPEIVVFDTDLELKHAYLNEKVIQLLKERTEYRKKEQYASSDNIRKLLSGEGIEIVGEDRNNSQFVVKDTSEINGRKDKFRYFLQSAYDSAKYLSLAEFQAEIHSNVIEEAINEYNLKAGKNVRFTGVTFIPETTLKRPGYDHVGEHHSGQDVVFLPVLQGHENGDIEKHKSYVREKYIRTIAEYGLTHDFPRIIITPNVSRLRLAGE